MTKKPIVYVAHPYGGDEQNKRKLESHLLQFYRDYPQFDFFSPIHNFGFAYNCMDYESGIRLCLDFLRHASELWVIGDWQSSRGCSMEVAFARQNGISTKFHKENDE